MNVATFFDLPAFLAWGAAFFAGAFLTAFLPTFFLAATFFPTFLEVVFFAAAFLAAFFADDFLAAFLGDPEVFSAFLAVFRVGISCGVYSTRDLRLRKETVARRTFIR